MQSVDSSGLNIGGYTSFDDPIEGALFNIRIANASDTSVFLSYDGNNDHEFIPANTQMQINFQSNNCPDNGVAKLRKGTIIYLRGNAGTGFIHLSGYYQK